MTFSTSGPCTPSGATTGVGRCTITASQAGNSTYSSVSVSQSFTITPAVLTVTAKPVNTTYGQQIPTLTNDYSIAGFVNRDPTSVVTGTPALSTTATAATYPGSYPITVSTGSLAATNYSFLYVPGTLTISFTGSVPASGTACNGAYSGTFKGNLIVVMGQVCVFIGGGASGNITESGGNVVLSGATVGGNITDTGGSVNLSGGTVGGNVTITGGSFSIGPSTKINGNLQIQNLPSSSTTNQVCAATISGSLQFQSNKSPVVIGSGTSSCASNVIKGSLQVLSNTAPVTLDGNTVSGNLQVETNSAAVTMDTNKVSGSLQVESNTGPTTLDGNTVGGSLQDQSNTGATQVISNVITGVLQCSSNTTITGSGNTAASKTGQCAKF